MLPIDEIRGKALRKYWDVVKGIARGETLFPMKIPFGRLHTITDYRSDKKQIEGLKAALDESRNAGLTCEWRQIKTRKYGTQNLPWRLFFATEVAYVEFVRKTREIENFRQDLKLIHDAFPQLEPWTCEHPREIVEKHGQWPGLLKVCRYFRENPLPGCYVRELPVSVNTKFIENNAAILTSLLDAVLPPHHRKENSRFEQRFGLKYDEACIRVRFLDTETQRRAGFPCADVTLPTSAFDCLSIEAHTTVIITENKMNFLALPNIANGLAILGGGQAVVLLQNGKWMNTCKIVYWGDIDAYGFQILAQLRRLFSHVKSVMMDEPTLDRFASYIVPGKPCPADTCEPLTAEEAAAYRRVVRLQQLLEQEHIDWEYVCLSLMNCLAAST